MTTEEKKAIIADIVSKMDEKETRLIYAIVKRLEEDRNNDSN